MKFLLSILGMTNQCNLKCTYCDWKKEPYRAITDAEYDNAKRYLTSIREEVDKRYPELMLVEYTGGEPLVYPKIVEILLTIFHDKWIRINTNGIGITDDIIQMMKAHGKAFFAFSLDSNTLEGNAPRFQGNGKLFQLVIDNFDKVLKNNIPIYLLCTINKYNINEFPDYVKYLEEKYEPYIKNGMLGMPAHYVTNYEKENGIPNEDANKKIKEFINTTDSRLLRKNYQHYKELEYYIENNNRLTTCTIPEWSLSVHYRGNTIVEDGKFLSFGCGMRGIYDLGCFDSLSKEDLNRYFDIADSKDLLDTVLKSKSSSSFHYGCQEMCFTDWVCFDMILQGKISLEDAAEWFVMFKDPAVVQFLKTYQEQKMNIEEIVIRILESYGIRNVNNFRNEINSYGFIEIIMNIEDAFGIHIGDEYLVMDKMSGLAELVKCIEEQKNK